MSRCAAFLLLLCAVLWARAAETPAPPQFGQPGEKVFAVVADGRGLAVHEVRGTHHAATEHMADGLMPEAHTEHRNAGLSERGDGVAQDARIFGPAWAGRQQQQVGPEVERLLLQVVAGGALGRLRGHDVEVVRAIEAGDLGRIAVAYLDFSERSTTRVLVPWRIVHDKESAADFANALLKLPRTRGVNTSIAEGIELGIKLISESSYEATQKTIDVSGDGPNNEGHLVTVAREAALARALGQIGHITRARLDKLVSAD